MKKTIGGLVSVVLLLGGVFCFAHAQTAAPLPPITAAQYVRSAPGDVFIMLVGLDSCRPCRMAEKLVFTPLLHYYAGQEAVHVVKVDVQAAGAAEQETIIKPFNVTSTPTLLVVQNGQILWRKVGFEQTQKDTTIQEIIRTVGTLY